MKKLLLIALALISIEGIAQQRMQQRPERKEMADKMFALTPEESATLQTKRMTLQLDLNEYQQKEIYKLNLENATKRQLTMEANKAKRESGTFERPTKQDYLSRMNARLDNQIATRIKMNYILNTEQRTKWEEAQAHMQNRLDKVMRNNKRFAQNNNFRNRRF
ncbi:MAG: hypothetical protein ACM31G_09360 [Flavobacteriales bacterium]